MANERLDRMVGKREKVGCPDTRQEKGCSSCELRGKDAIPYTSMNLESCVVATRSQVGVVAALSRVEVLESLFVILLSKRQRVVALALPNLQLQGTISPSLANLSFLSVLNLGNNLFHGGVPNGLAHLPRLRVIDVQNNQLEGRKLSNLRQLIIVQNYNLNGQIPECIFNISSLETICFNFNNLSGRIPATTGLHLANLEGLYLAHNQLDGEIPLFITNASKLEILELAHNFLTGPIPTNLGNLRELQHLFLHTNQLTNEPRDYELRFLNSLVDCGMLRYVQVGSNPLNGILPNSIGNLSSSIELIFIGDAHINGHIPTSIGNVSGLTALDLGGTNLAGSIPYDVGKLKKIEGLYLNNNKLHGHIPEAVCHLTNLVELTLDFNELFGLIPECLGNHSTLQKISLSSNKLSSKFPLMLWKMSGLLSLDVSQNSIEGEVPWDIGGLKALVYLNLSANHFSGMIPSRVGELQNLQSLDLSNNSFFGQIPLSFPNLISLEFLDLSLNALSEGEIPSGGVFVNSTWKSFLGNKGLCGVHILEVPACANPGKQSKSKDLVLKVVTLVVISSCLIFFLVSIWIMKRKKKGKSKDVEKVPEIKTHQLVSYHEIQRATNYFDESNLIGVGSSGSVYKGTLSSGIVVAIKILDLEYEEVCKRFDTECEVMRNVRHRNLVPVITTFSSDYIRSFVQQYMSNGSLENWLYREDCQLNLLQRVTVMLDAAMGIEYLHHGHITPIVHCDLKPGNILLDDDMVAHVGDFGISKILAVSKSMA
ncbi:receptor kinase-like protein Xa21 [Capsicum annuum]|uniref:receptor kinase-like protein Xa21 n=1 Tax=Capsicum annuum TaxID=4072 RepID=UPI001FB09937|nr:receptor kinase-like protein Xa21 [Capsicum annuum]